MAKVKTPLLSFEGTGTIGKNLTFQRYPRGIKVYHYKKHADAQAAAQLTQRSYFDEARTIWNLLDQPTKDLWKEEAGIEYISGYHAFLSWYIKKTLINPILYAWGPLLWKDRWWA